MLDRAPGVVRRWFVGLCVILQKARVVLHSKPCRDSKKNRSVPNLAGISAGTVPTLPACTIRDQDEFLQSSSPLRSGDTSSREQAT